MEKPNKAAAVIRTLMNVTSPVPSLRVRKSDASEETTETDAPSTNPRFCRNRLVWSFPRMALIVVGTPVSTKVSGIMAILSFPMRYLSLNRRKLALSNLCFVCSLPLLTAIVKR